MLELPATTAFNKRIPKQKFYDNLSVTPELKRVFVEQISAIYWRNKIATSTLNMAAGERITELEVFEIRLTKPELDTRVLQLIDKEIPYHILFLLGYDGRYQAWIGYKEPSLAKQGVFKVNTYYNTDWVEPDKLFLRLEGLTIDAIYDGFVRQIAGERLASQNGTATSLKDAVERDTQRQLLLKQISVLEKRVNNEKQFNRRVELNAELKKLKSDLSELE